MRTSHRGSPCAFAWKVTTSSTWAMWACSRPRTGRSSRTRHRQGDPLGGLGLRHPSRRHRPERTVADPPAVRRPADAGPAGRRRRGQPRGRRRGPPVRGGGHDRPWPPARGRCRWGGGSGARRARRRSPRTPPLERFRVLPSSAPRAIRRGADEQRRQVPRRCYQDRNRPDRRVERVAPRVHRGGRGFDPLTAHQSSCVEFMALQLAVRAQVHVAVGPASAQPVPTGRGGERV